MYYCVKVDYAAGTPFRGFFNNFLFDGISARIPSTYKFFCGSFFIKGQNSVTIAWGPMPGEIGWDPEAALSDELPEFSVSLVSSAEFGGEETLIFEKTFTPDDVVEADGVRLPAYRAVFDNPTSLDFSYLLVDGVRCNKSEELLRMTLARMRKFCRSVYDNLRSGSVAEIVKSSEIRLGDDAKSQKTDIKSLSYEYEDVLSQISGTGLAYKLKRDEQIVLLPTCEGRLWRMVIIESPEEAEEIMNSIGMLPHAIIDFDFDLIQTKRDEGFSVKLPSYIAEVGGSFRIVR